MIEKEYRNSEIIVMVTEAEKSKIRDDAKDAGLNLSAYVRLKLGISPKTRRSRKS